MSNPYLIDRPALIAFSGGRTSGFMLWHILQAYGGKLPDDVIPTFCNTGLEHPATLDFVKACGDHWGVQIIWLEYRFMDLNNSIKLGLNPIEGRLQGSHWFEIVNYETASRNGEPFSAIIEQRHFLPNPVTRFCTVELKIRTMDRYGLSLGWDDGYTEAVGLRADEPHRVSRIKSNARRNEVVCPMAQAKHTSRDVEEFWDGQPFKLGIPQHQGNCQGCFLKSRYRLEQVARETPEAFDWWIDQESRVRDWAKDRVAKSFRFRNDRASYRRILEMAKSPTLFDECETDDTMPCNCTD